MVMPRSRSSGALSIESNARYSAEPFSARYLLIAAVSDVLPWSMWPIVPTLTCGFVRSNFFLATGPFSLRCFGRPTSPGSVSTGDHQWSPHWDSNPRPLPYQGSALPAELCGRSLGAGGADDGTRTRNRRFTKPLLYQLSYVGTRAASRK